MSAITYHKPIPNHRCRPLFVAGISRHTCTTYWWQPIGYAPKTGAR